MRFRKQATEVKDLVKEIKAKQQRIAELTASGDLTTTFHLHEELNKQSKLATDIACEIARNTECNTILQNSLESKMKAAADISEYEQAQNLKQALEVSFYEKSQPLELQHNVEKRSILDNWHFCADAYFLLWLPGIGFTTL